MELAQSTALTWSSCTPSFTGNVWLQMPPAVPHKKGVSFHSPSSSFTWKSQDDTSDSFRCANTQTVATRKLLTGDGPDTIRTAMTSVTSFTDHPNDRSTACRRPTASTAITFKVFWPLRIPASWSTPSLSTFPLWVTLSVQPVIGDNATEYSKETQSGAPPASTDVQVRWNSGLLTDDGESGTVLMTAVGGVVSKAQAHTELFKYSFPTLSAACQVKKVFAVAVHSGRERRCVPQLRPERTIHGPPHQHG